MVITNLTEMIILSPCRFRIPIVLIHILAHLYVPVCDCTFFSHAMVFPLAHHYETYLAQRCFFLMYIMILTCHCDVPSSSLISFCVIYHMPACKLHSHAYIWLNHSPWFLTQASSVLSGNYIVTPMTDDFGTTLGHLATFTPKMASSAIHPLESSPTTSGTSPLLTTISVSLPTFWTVNTEAWFHQARVQFLLWNIAAEEMCYFFIMSSMDAATYVASPPFCWTFVLSRTTQNWRKSYWTCMASPMMSMLACSSTSLTLMTTSCPRSWTKCCSYMGGKSWTLRWHTVLSIFCHPLCTMPCQPSPTPAPPPFGPSKWTDTW